MSIVYLLMFFTAAPFLVLLRDISPTSLGSLSGFMGITFMLWQTVLGLRFISSKFTPDTVGLNKLHKNLGIYGALFIFAHPIFKAITYYGSVKYAILPDFSDPQFLQVGFGRLAFTLFLVVWISSAFFRKKLGFRVWKYIHYFTYLIIIFVLLHAPTIGTSLNTYAFLKTYWYLLSGIFGSVLIYRVLVFMGIGSSKYILKEKTKVGDVFLYTFETIGKTINPKVGQYCYIKIKKFGEEHPFTVMESFPEKNKLVFGIKAQGKFTNKLSNLAVGDSVMVEGPYGVFTLEGQNQHPKVIISGGIGITPFVDLIAKHGDENTYMFYANRTLDTAVKRETLKSKLGNRYFDVLSEESKSGQNIINGRLNKEIMNTSLSKSVIDSANYFICGSKPFYSAYRKLLLSLNVSKSRIYYEEFGF